MEFDAVILAGGRSARLSGVPKAGLLVDGSTLLALALRAARGARRVVVVGPDPGTLPDSVLNCREEPPFAGPAAAIAAGLAKLAENAADPARDDESAAGGPAADPDDAGRGPAPLTLVLACDMPRAAAAVGVLLAAAAGAGVAGSAAPAGGSRAEAGSVMAVSADGRRQPLVALYDTAALQRSVADAARRGALENASVFALLASLEVREVRVPAGSTDDVDTWDDASALGVSTRGPAAPATTGQASAPDHDFGG